MWLGPVALILVFLSVKTDVLRPLQERLSMLSTPFYWVTDIPTRMGEWGTEAIATRELLEQENQALKKELLITNRKLQKLAVLAAENVRLRHLMSSAELSQERVLIAELIGVSPDPLSHRVVVNRGSRDGVYVGQPVMDANGLMGQVVDVNPLSSQVLLITDSTHGTPVQVNRNGVRAILEGTGDLYRMKLRHVSSTVDVVEGDLLVSSGLGGRFPEGHPVGVVKQIMLDPGQPFAEVFVEPKAQMNRSRHVLLVFEEDLSESSGG